jgi:toxin ParE1/3/4
VRKFHATFPTKSNVPKRREIQVVISGPAKRDLAAITRWSKSRFGEAATLRYEALLLQALQDIGDDPERPGSLQRPDLAVEGVRTYHLSFSRARVSGSKVKTPRHFILYRRTPPSVIEVGRILHDSRDLSQHLPEEYRRASSISHESHGEG